VLSLVKLSRDCGLVSNKKSDLIIPELGRLRQENREFEASLSYTVISYFPTPHKKRKKCFSETSRNSFS
jgi:hypothetical protein